MTLQTLILRYAAFAVVATLANLATQRAILHYGDTGPYFALRLARGPLLASSSSTLLDKRWIFLRF